jgi:3-isopropylmalate/(R)-2-methylmalate dehydratase small subunit
MRAFTFVEGVAASLPIDNVDTDKIIPARFMKTVERDGLGKGLFAALRAAPGFVLNNAPWDRAEILVSGKNFGCGSSREHAPWALLDFGIRCIIAPSFSDIFRGNCFKNGILAVTLDGAVIADLGRLARDPRSARFRVDLETCHVEAGGLCHSFPIDAALRENLLHGIDEIGATLACLSDIEAFERGRGTTPAIDAAELGGLVHPAPIQRGDIP